MRPLEVSARAVEQRARDTAERAGAWLDALIERAELQRPGRWRRDLADIESYLVSIEPGRARLRELLRLDPAPTVESPPTSRHQVGMLGPHPVCQLTWEGWPGLRCEALLLLADTASRPAVVACHGLLDTAESFAGLIEPNDRSAVVAALLAAGCHVIVPRLVTGWHARLHLARKARLIGREWLGIEVLGLVRLLDRLADLPVDPAAVGAWGFSRGGQVAMLLAALDSRIAAVSVASWFGDRTARLLDTRDARQTAYLDSPEEEQFVPGWLIEFSDAELAGLIVPEPLQVTSGLDDPVVPFEQVESAFAPVAGWFRALGLSELAELELFVGGHSPSLATVAFLARWLGCASVPAPAIDRPLRRRPRVSAARRLRARLSRRRAGRRPGPG